MKPQELMVGDWVRLVADNEKEVLQVNYVRRDGVGFKKYAVYFDEIESIPLTAEILEKSGFIIRNDFAFAKNTKCDIKIDLTNQINSSILSYNEGFSIYMKFKFVHELQHALRLCGLGELANNFKI